MATSGFDAIFRAMRGAVDQVERAVKGRNRRLIVKYRDVLENKLENVYSELGRVELKEEDRKAFEAQCDDVERLARDAIFQADECITLMQDDDDAASVAKVAEAEVIGFIKKVETIQQLLQTNPQDIVEGVDSDKAWSLINSSITDRENGYKELGSAYISVCQYVAGKKFGSAESMEKQYSKLQVDYVTWLEQAQRVRGLLKAPAKVSEYAPKSFDMRIEPLQLPVFKGEVREYARFRREFSNTVEKRFVDDQVRCLYLQNQCLKGPAKELVKGLNSFQAVVERLDLMYGKPTLIINEVLHDLESLKVSGEGEQKGVLKLCNFLQSAWDDLEAVGSLGEFCNVVTLQTIESKLMPGSQLKWATEKSTFTEAYDSATAMLKLKQFLEKERKIAEDVLLMRGKSSGISQSVGTTHRDKNFGKFSGYASDASEAQTKGKGSKACFRCGRQNHFVRDCKVPRSIVCRGCGETGHIQNACPGKKAAHEDSKKGEIDKKVNFKEPEKEDHKVGVVANSSKSKDVQVRLPIETVQTEFGDCNVLWDSGSTLNLVSSGWIQKHCISGKRCRLKFKAVGGSDHCVDTELYSFNLKSRDGSFRLVRAYRLDSIASSVLSLDINSVVSMFNVAGVVVDNNEISNPVGEVELLLGSELMAAFPKTSAAVDQICLMSSDFGLFKFFVAGSHGPRLCVKETDLVHGVYFAKSVSVTPLDNVCDDVVAKLDGSVKRNLQLDFWSLESLGVRPPPICNNCRRCKFCSLDARKLTINEAKELDVIRYNLNYVAEKEKWSTVYPYIKSPSTLRDNYGDALRALARREASLLKDQRTAALYDDQVSDFVKRGVLRKLNKSDLEEWEGPIRYVDHRHVLKESSTTPVRLVINSSFSRKGESSLNSILMKGPNILNCLFETLVRWRTWPVAFVGDIEKMYHNVETGDVEAHVRRLLWRSYETDRAPDVYVFRTVTFGDKPAGCIVMSALRATAEMFRSVSNEAANIIIRDSYMDDIVSGSCSKEEAVTAMKSIQEIAKKGGFNFKKFTTSWMNTEGEHVENVLGVRWKVADDKLSPNMKDAELFERYKGKWSRRLCWKYTSSFFDPLGICVPVTVRMKILMKTMFVENRKYSDWDAALLESDQSEWDKLAADVYALRNYWVNRSCVPVQMACRERCYLIGFCDASINALCAVVYFRFDDENGGVSTSFLAAKSRVTPVKRETMPRLELCGALLLARLMAKCKTCLMFSTVETIYLCDSKIVLGQLANTKRLVNDFVGVRVLETRDKSVGGRWAYVPSEENTADLGSRGAFSKSLSGKWVSGPAWITDEVDCWPVEFCDFDDGSVVLQVTEQEPVIDVSKYSKLSKLVRVTAVCLLFLGSRGNGKSTLRDKRENVCIPVHVLEAAEMFWLKEVNKHSVELMNSGKIDSLRPSLVWNEQGKFPQVVTSGRVGSAMKVGYDTVELPILDPKHPYVRLLIREYHEKEHAGDDRVLWQLRAKYWVPQARRLVRKIRKDCIRCRLLNKRVASQLMAPLPNERVLPTPPWTNTSVDLFGPFECRDVVKKRMKIKVWGIIFTCLVSRASHLDVTTTYGTDSVLQALRRFISIRGCPRQIISDQGTQLVACSKEVEFLLELINWDLVFGWCSSKGISWKLVPPQGQHMNGCSEALVRVTKRVLSQRLEGIQLTHEELQTVLFEVSNVLNSRPLGIFAKPGDDPLDGGPLTPNHLLMGRATSSIPHFNYSNVNLTRRVRFLQDVVKQFWEKWHVVAFPSLIPQYKWRVQERDMRVGDVVLMRDESALPGDYKLGQISGVRVGNDNHVRTVTVRYVKSSDGGGVHGYVARPVHKLVVILPVEDQ